jgi:hypothetical protein
VNSAREVEKRATGTIGASSDAEVQDDLAALLEQLTRQKAELRSGNEKGEARRLGKLRKRETEEKLRKAPEREVWKRPSGYGSRFGELELLPVKYLSPFEQQAACRPSRAYERAPDPEKGPFRDVSTYPQLFPEALQEIHQLPPGTPKAQGRAFRVKTTSLGSRAGGVPNAIAKVTDSKWGTISKTEKQPQNAPLVTLKPAALTPPWLPNYGTPREIDKFRYLDERLPKLYGVVC